MSALVLVVSPSINAKGMRASSIRGPLFNARLDGRLIVSRSAQPLLDSGRALIAEGFDPATRIVMRHAGSEVDALQATVGAAAGLTVSDDNGGKPVFKTWQPYEGPSRVSVNAPMRESELGGLSLWPDPENAPATASAPEAAE